MGLIRPPENKTPPEGGVCISMGKSLARTPRFSPSKNETQVLDEVLMNKHGHSKIDAAAERRQIERDRLRQKRRDAAYLTAERHRNRERMKRVRAQGERGEARP
jgi:hypothetical protein